MADIQDLSEARRALLARYLRGDAPVPLAATVQPRNDAGEVAASDAVSGARVSVVPIQPVGTKRPFFYLHPHWYGGAGYCFTIAHVLGSDQPFYMLDPYRYDGMRVPPSFETVARAYIQAVRSVQPTGPYLLGGFCGGGLIAFEMARQLHAQGQAVDLLAMIEAVDGPALHRMLPRRIVGSAFRQIGGIFRLNTEQQLDWFARVRYAYLLLRYRSTRAGKTFWQSIWPFPTVDELRQDPIGLFVWALSEYRPTRYLGKITYLWAREEAAGRFDGWHRAREAEEIEHYEIAGTHGSCRNQDVGDLARRLKLCLDGVQ
jgi:thioesterase domain-containing protein